MIYGIEQTTDHRSPETRVVRFRSQRSAESWASKDAEFAWPGAADSNLPPAQQNWHRRIRRIYEMPPGWRPPTRTALRKQVSAQRSPSRYKNETDFLADEVMREGEQIRLDLIT